MRRSTSRRALLLVPALVLALFAGSFLGGSALANHRFSDVGTNSEFHDEINWLAEQGIAGGYPDGTFRPSAPVTRQAMAAFLGRTVGRIRLETATVNPAIGTVFAVQVSCGPNERVLGGGARLIDTDVYMTQSIPAAAESAWFVMFESENNVVKDPATLTGWALCGPRLMEPS